MNKIEVIAWTLEDAINIEKFGAHRIELVKDLPKGGLTPDYDLVKKISESVNIPVRVMIREIDNSFVYDEKIMKKHLNFIEKISLLKIEGIVFGSLKKNNLINFDQLKQVISKKGNMKLTFHRAFDEINEENVISEFEKLSKYDVDTLLTSGTKNSAIEGKEIIKKLVYKNKINILPGKSIGIENAEEILNFTGANWIHVGYSVRDENGNISKLKIKKLLNEIGDK